MKFKITSPAKYGHRSYFKWMISTDKSYNGKPQSFRGVFCFFSQGFKQTYILKRIKKKYLALELNSVKIGKYALALGCQRFWWAISNNSFFKLATWVFASSCAITLIRFGYLNFCEVLLCLGWDCMLLGFYFQTGSCKNETVIKWVLINKIYMQLIVQSDSN